MYYNYVTVVKEFKLFDDGQPGGDQPDEGFANIIINNNTPRKKRTKPRPISSSSVETDGMFKINNPLPIFLLHYNIIIVTLGLFI